MNLVNFPLLGASPFGTIVIRYKNEDIDSNLFDLFFFSFVQVCPVRSAGSQCLLPSDAYAHATCAAEANRVDMRVGRCTLLMCYFSWEILA